MRYLYIVLTGVLLTAFCNYSLAQVVVNPHDTTACNGAVTLYATVNGGSVVGQTTINNINDDYYSNVIPIGFTFNFYGINYTNCVICSNGYVSFNTANANSPSGYAINVGIPNNPLMRNSIAGYFADLDMTSNNPPGTITYGTYGVAPNRKFVVTFCHDWMYQCNTNFATFQIIMYETTNEAEVHIGTTMNPICSWNGGAAIEGVQDNGSSGVAVPGRNFPTQWTAYHSSHRFTPSGLTYTVTPIPYAPVPNAANPYIYWYNVNTGQLIAQGVDSIQVAPTQVTTYKALVISCGDTASDTARVTPMIPVGPVTAINPTCVGNNGSITISGLTPAAALTLNYNLNGVPQGPFNVIVDPNGNIVLSGLGAGMYDPIVLSNATGCFTGDLGPDSLFYPTLTIDSISWTDPSCLGHDGTITVYGMPPNDTTIIIYRNNGIPQPPFTTISNGLGEATVNNVDAGLIDSIVAGHYCFSAPVGPITLVYPGLLIDSAHVTEPSQCGLTDGFITISPIGLHSGDIVVVDYNKDGTPQPSYTTTVSAAGTIILGSLGAGTYDNITVTYGHCVSLPVGEYILNNPQFLSSFDYKIQLGCNGDTVIFQNESGNGTSYTWDFGDQTTATDPNPTHIYQTQGIYTVILHTFNGTCEKTTTHEITLVHPVISSFTAVRDSICEHQTVHFDGASSTNAYTYVWDFGDGKMDSTNRVAVSHTYNTPGTYTAALTVIDFVPCPNTSTHPIVVAPFEIHAVNADTSICIYDQMQIRNVLDVPSYIGQLYYAWSPADHLSDPTVQQPLFYAADTMWHTYVVTMTSGDPFNCITTDTQRIFAQPHVHLLNVTPEQTLMYGQSVHLNADGAYYFTWIPALYLDNSNIKDPIATPAEPLTYTVFAMNQYGGCRDTAYVKINLIYDDEFVPTAFTPNGDGKNDVFRITNMRAGQKLLEFRVYDRWGQKIFETDDVSKGWDGNFKGKAMDSDVFQYMIRISLPDGTQRVHKGDVTLIR